MTLGVDFLIIIKQAFLVTCKFEFASLVLSFISFKGRLHLKLLFSLYNLQIIAYNNICFRVQVSDVEHGGAVADIGDHVGSGDVRSERGDNCLPVSFRHL